jgi:hypothetical protein
MSKRIFVILILICPIVLILPSLGQFAFPPGSPYSDLVISHLPNALYIKHSLSAWHQIPLWSDQILSGYPFAADPLSGLWYPPGWLAVVLPEPFGFNLLIALHILFGGIGLFLFLRSENLGELPALLGAFTFELMPKLFAHFASGHITLLYAVFWTPWLILIEKEKTVSKRKIFHFLTAIILGMIALADVRWAAYASVLWIAYSFYLARKNLAGPGFLSWFGPVFGEMMVALLIASPLLLPLIEFTHLSTRNLLQPGDNLMLSLGPAQLLGLFIPQFWGYAETIVYPGILSFLLVLAVVCSPDARQKSYFWAGVILVTLLFSMGSNLPGAEFLARLPGFSLLRVPTRWLFITCLAFSILAAHGAQALSIENFRKLARPNPAIFYVGLSAFAVFLAMGLLAVSKSIPLPFLWSAIFIPLSSILILLRANLKITTGWWFPLIFGLAVLDLGSISLSQVNFQDASVVMDTQKEVGIFLGQQPKPFRIYSPSYSVPQQVGSCLDLRLADGINPLQLLDYANFMTGASGVPSTGYSVTLPPFSTGNPLIDNQAYLPDASRLGLLNVRFVAAEYQLASDELLPVARFGQTQIYENSLVKPPAWVQMPDLPAGEGISSTPIPDITPNRITLAADGPGLLVLSEINYPGWVVRVDNTKANIIPAAGILRAVDLPAGRHKIVFSYEPMSMYAGIVLAAAAWLGILVFGLRGKK